MHTTALNKDLTCALVCKRHTRFSCGRSSLDDDKGRGRKPRIDSDAITSILDEFDIDRRLTVSALATMAYVGIWTVFMILTEYLNMSNVHALCLLKDSKKERRVRDLKSFLKHYEKECASMQQPNVTLSPLSKQPTTSYGSIHIVRARCPWIWESWSPCIFPVSSNILCWCIS